MSDRDWTAPPSEETRDRRLRLAAEATRATRAYVDAFPDHEWVRDPDDGTGYCRRCLLPSARWGGDKCPDEWAVNARALEVVDRARRIEQER